MNNRQMILVFILFLVFVTGCNVPGSPPSYEQEALHSGKKEQTTKTTQSSDILLSTSAPPSGDVLTPEDFEYLGAFRLPGESGSSNWEYSGRGLTFYPDGNSSNSNDGLPGSLFGVGHDHQQHVSEISIPVPVNSRNIEDLPTAQTLQPFTDITNNMFGDTELPRLGLQYLPGLGQQTSGKLHFVHGQHFQDFEPSNGWSELDLENPNPDGPWNVNGYTNYITSDYVFEIPEDWAMALPGTPRLATGRFREGVWAGGGPALVAIQPWTEGNPPAAGATLERTTLLLLYGIQEPGLTDIISDEEMKMSEYLEPDHWIDGAWLNTESKAAVVFVGTKAMGNAWYGFANGLEWAYDCAEHNPPTCPEPPDWPYDNRGYWADDYMPQILFFNPSDLISVANGEMASWQPQPYAIMDLSEYFFDPVTNIEEYKQDITGAMAFDRENGLVYVVERLADEYKSVIHVWKISK